jgi:hypothetical protein
VKTKLPCTVNVIEIDPLFINENLYLKFRFCCASEKLLIVYSFDDVIKDFDQYFNKCLKLIKDLKICEKCDKYDGFEISEKAIAINNGLSILCTQKCKFCAAYPNGGVLKYFSFNDIKKLQEKNKIFMECMLKSEKLKQLTVTCRGETFEDAYIKNEFLFTNSINSFLE